MSKSVKKPPDYVGRRSDLGEPDSYGCTFAILALCLLAIAAFLWANEAMSMGRMVFLEGERDLGNGMKHCLYTEGVVITIPSYKLCPLSVEV